MKHAHSGARRSVGSIATLALLAGGTAVLAAPVQAAPAAAPRAAAASVDVDGASLTWGLNGYAQKGIFGPWTFKDLTGNVTQLTGSVSGGTQTEYVVGPVPATSMPASTPQKTPNAVKFTAGTGTADVATGASSLEWDGSYTVNAYPAQYGAPDEIYSDPQLTTAADGSGTLTMNFALGAGVDMSGNPVPAQDFGRLTLATFAAGASAPITGNPDGYRLTPAYQGVATTIPADGSAQVTTCSTDGGATGWWGSWPQELITALPGSVRPHFYSTGCGGNQDNKPALPMDVDLNTAPAVTVSDTTLLPSGVQEVTVTGSGFFPGLATGTRPPLAGKAAGAYIAFGRYADVWRPSAGAASSARVNQGGGALKWAVPAEDMASIGGAAGGAVELEADGTFTATLAIDKDAMDSKATSGNYGIYTYPGSGGSQAAYETFTPVTFAKAEPTVSVTASNATYGADVPVTVTLAGDSVATGDVTLTSGTTSLGTATLAGGTATFTLARPAAGTHEITVSYPGDANTEPVEGTGTVTVAKVVPAIGVTATGGQAGADVSVKVTVPAAATGNVVLKDGATTVGTTAVSGGAATFTLGGLTAGEHALVASYAGDGNHEAASGTTRVRVTAAAVDGPVKGIAKVTWGTRPTAGKRGTAVVRVSELATGKATAIVRNAKGKKVTTLTVRIKDGVAKVKLPKLAKGRFTLVVKVPGNDAVAKARVTRTFRVR